MSSWSSKHDEDLRASLEHLTGELLQTRFQIDEASRAASRAADRLRGTVAIWAAGLSFVTVAYIVAAFLPLLVPAASDGHTWVRWHQLGGTWDPLSAWPTKKACEAVALKEPLAQRDPAYRCLPDTVDPRGPKGGTR